MAIRYAAQRGVALQNTIQAIADREPFNAGNLTGQRYSQGTGQLRGYWLEQFHAEVNEMDYIVYSYATPIAWHTPKAHNPHDGGWVVIELKFSATTSRHQSVTHQGIERDES